MRRLVILLLITIVALAWARSGRAQSASVALEAGTLLRVTGCLPACDTRLEGELLRVDADSLVLAGRGHVATVALADVHRIEVGTPHRFSGRKALLWGGGTALVTALLGASDESAGAGEVLAVAAVWGGGAAVFAGGGRRAVRAGGVGALIGAPIGGVLFVLAYEPCSGQWLCFAESEEALFAWGAVAGAATGFLIGGAIGAFSGGNRWEEVAWNGVRLSAAPTRYGLALRASLPFRVR